MQSSSVFATEPSKSRPRTTRSILKLAGRHDLKPIEVITEDGKIAENADFAKYSGLEIDDAREKIVSDLDAAGALGEVKPFVHQVPHCYKCGRVIQPLLKKQWFIDVQTVGAAREKSLRTVKFALFQSKKDRKSRGI